MTHELRGYGRGVNRHDLLEPITSALVDPPDSSMAHSAQTGPASTFPEHGPGPPLLIPLRPALRRRLDGDPLRHFDAVLFQQVADLAPYLGRAVAALTQDAVNAATKTSGDGVGPGHGA